MAAFERNYVLKLLPFGARSPKEFTEAVVPLDPMRHTCCAIKELLSVRGLLCHGGAIVPDEALLKNWHDPAAPIVIIASAPDWEESDSWAKNSNPVARLLNCHAPIECALVALGRSYWQPGFDAFFSAASVLRNLVDATGTSDFQRRSEYACVNRGELHPVMVFNEHSGEVLPPPCLRGDVTGGDFVGEWVDVPKPHLSSEELRHVADESRQIRDLSGAINAASDAVVRMFGYHTLSSSTGDERLGVHSFTAFFVAPGLLMTSRTAAFNKHTNTFAHTFRFTRRVRALHGMLTPGVDLFEARPLDGLSEVLVRRMRSLGIAIEDNKVPPGMFACPWNDITLFEVIDGRERLRGQILLPEILTQPAGHLPKRGDRLFALSYSTAPDARWVDDSFGPNGHNADGTLTAEHLRVQFWSHDIKCCSIGTVHADFRPEGEALLQHTCTLLPGSRGAPLLGNAVTASTMDAETPILTYCGVACGRPDDAMAKEIENIVSMSTSMLARRESLASNVYNEALPSSHLTLVLLYQEIIQHRLTDPAHRAHVRKYLAPYDIFVDPSLLSNCHQKMLIDADDHNEFGMDFYQHHDLANALACFREGAKMFSTASIPNLSDHDQELKVALQTNVSAVVVARMNLVQ